MSAATSDASQRRGQHPLFTGPVIMAAWLINIGLLLSIVLWIWNDPLYMLRWSSSGNYPGTQSPYVLPMSPTRWAVLRGGTIAAVVSASIMLVGLVFGAPRQRGLRAWLLLTAVAAGWLALAMSWRDLQWASQTSRLRIHIPEFEALAEPLREQWPKDDGVLPTIGPFSSYANDESRVLMMLTSPKDIAERAWGISTIERSPTGGLRFELEGAEQGAWIEWHPLGDAPASFVGGLATSEVLKRSAPLGGGWFATRYATSPHE